MNIPPYTLTFENDYDSIFTLVMKVDLPKMPWEIDDKYDALTEHAYDRAADTSVVLGDYTLRSISYGGMEIASFD
jgi:hypothetical protein